MSLYKRLGVNLSLCVVLLSLLCGTVHAADIEFRAAPRQVRVGQQISLELGLSIPKEAFGAFLAYMSFMSASRPLPGPLLIESVTLRGKKATLAVRLMSVGTFEIPLGVFTWKNKSFPLPILSIEVTPLEIPVLTLNDAQVPFPGHLVEPSAENHRIQEALSEQTHQRGSAILTRQRFFRLALGLLLLVAVSLPFLIQLWKWRKMRKPHIPSTKTSPQESLQQIKLQLEKDKEPWTELLRLINQLNVEKIPLTAHELKVSFSQKGDTSLSEGSSLVEQYAYRPGSSEGEFREALKLVEGVVLKK